MGVSHLFLLKIKIDLVEQIAYFLSQNVKTSTFFVTEATKHQYILGNI